MEVGLLCSVRLWFFAKPCRVRRRENLCHGLSGDDSKPVQASKGGVSLELLSLGGGYQGQLGVPPSKLKGDKGEASKKTINRGVKITFPDGGGRDLLLLLPGRLAATSKSLRTTSAG